MYSIFDILKESLGPSSSHTTGPMVAAQNFVEKLEQKRALSEISTIQITLYGSLAFTGRAHGTEKGIILGLEGYKPTTLNSSLITKTINSVYKNKKINILQSKKINFDPDKCILFDISTTPTAHSNTMEIKACDSDKNEILKKTYYSIGGGFIRVKGEREKFAREIKAPYEFNTAEELINICSKEKLQIHELAMANESTVQTSSEIKKRILSLWETMDNSIQNGLITEGILEGGLNTRRRAAGIYKELNQSRVKDPLKAMDWVNVYAMAVNEENAAGGKVVTAPTNGAAGIVPAVIKYYLDFTRNPTKKGVVRFLLTAGTIGILYKKNASISGAEVGCQGEVGVACSMAAGGLVSALKGSNQEIENAAEIAMEHNLGLTCDPIKGLVQIPCIERNAMGAVKSINAARLSMLGKGTHKVTLDQVIKTMMETGKDMQSTYKETSQGGLAVNVVEC